jgi:hypothetical protein
MSSDSIDGGSRFENVVFTPRAVRLSNSFMLLVIKDSDYPMSPQAKLTLHDFEHCRLIDLVKTNILQQLHIDG